jgi:AcrR family transcriptional regulator
VARQASTVRRAAAGGERPNQRNRTRKDLLRAASRLLQAGRQPTLDEVAVEALVSRATAYRYFANAEALLLEASLDVAVPEADQVFAGTTSVDPVERMQLVETKLHDMIAAHDRQLRLMLAHTLTRAGGDGADGEVPVRQNRRAPLIDAALAPAKAAFTQAALDTLRKALALVVGTEGAIVCKDVLRLDDAEARRVKLWAVRALVEAALAAGPGGSTRRGGDARTGHRTAQHRTKDRRSGTGNHQERKK